VTTDPSVDLTDPELGSKLLKDPRGKLPILVWNAYIKKHGGRFQEISYWLKRSEPDGIPIDAQEAVEQARKLLDEELMDYVVFSRRDPALHEKATHATYGLLKLMTRASSSYRKRGQPATMRPAAVRAFVIRKFNPSISWDKLADILFLENGKCPRRIADTAAKVRTRGICGKTRHQYNSQCVKALITAVNHLHTAMKHDGIPV
jgi:hypothetical protein